MASLIPGYEYDVFISYRQNDNKYDGWVTAFVHNLTLELEATSKDRISVYFDINPQDGLLETHTVGKSLEEKLKCLIFIPIISKTYCDKSSFAWQQELCAFNRLAQNDKFGRDIKLSRGNFASRILPVKIHELEHEDRILIENELGGVLRSIDFIYKSAGVNRPLRANEDHPQDNINNTYYRDQINKVANAIAEIISALKHESVLRNDENISALSDSVTGAGKVEKKPKLRNATYWHGVKFWVISIGLITLLAIFLKFLYPVIKTKGTINELGFSGDRISVAVMPFHNLTNDSTLNYLRLGVQNGIVTGLSFYPEDFKVKQFDLVRNVLKSENISDFSSITVSSGSSVSKKLDADLFILGDIYKTGDVIYINAQLIDSKTEEIIKSFKVGGIVTKINDVIESIPKTIRDYLLITKIQKESTKNNRRPPYTLHYLSFSPDAYRCHILAFEAFYSLDYHLAIKLDSQAVAIDSNYVGAIVTLSWENFLMGKYEEAKKWLLKAYNKRNKLPLIEQFSMDFQYASMFQTPTEQIKYVQQILKMEDKDPYFYLILAYIFVSQRRYEESISEFEKAQEIFKKWGSEPNDLIYFHFLMTAYHKTGRYKKEKEVIKNAESDFIKRNNQSKTGGQYLKMAVIYADANLCAKADEYFDKAISLDPGNPYLFETYSAILIDNNINVDKGLEAIDRAIELNPGNGNYLDTKGWGFYRKGKYDEALVLLEKANQMVPSFDVRMHIDSVKAAMMKQK
jgi:tetratricopeptide (TPR) repeat protein